MKKDISKKVYCSKCNWARKRSYEDTYDNAFCVSFDRCNDKNKNNDCTHFEAKE